MTVGGEIAQLIVPADAYGTPDWNILDWVHSRAYLLTTTTIRSYACSLTTQSPILSANLTGTAYFSSGDADPSTGNIIIQAAAANNIHQPIQKYDPTTLTITGSYGDNSNFSSYPDGIEVAEHVVCVSCGTLASGGASQIGYSLSKGTIFSGYVSAVRLDNMTQAGAYLNVVNGAIDNRAIMCRGASGPSGGSAFLSWYGGINGQTATIPLYVVTVLPGAETYNPGSWPVTNPYISSSTVGTIAASSVDAAWTTLQANSIGYDSIDGNVLMEVYTTNAVPNQYYMIKVNSGTAAIIWVSPQLTEVDSLEMSSVNGLIGSLPQVFPLQNPYITSIYSSTGISSSVSIDGLSSSSRISSDDSLGLIFFNTYYVQGAGNPIPVAGTPSSFTNGWAFMTGPYTPPPPPPIPIPIPESLGRWRGQVGLNWLGMALVGDAFSNVVGLSDYNAFTEYGNTMRFLVTTPPLHDDRKRIFIPRFEIEVEAGQGIPSGGIDDAPQIMLDISKDGGKTWGDLQRWRSMGKVGDYIQRLRWINLGHSRTWIFRLTCTDPVRRYVIGTYVDQYKGLG